MSNLAGKVVVITGASSGLGEATARLLSEQGALVVLGARRIDRLQRLVEELNNRGGQATAVQTDVRNREQVKRLVDTAVEAHGRLDVIINNAGLMPQSLLERLKVEEWDQMIDVNIKGVLYGIAAALPYMIAQQSGHIINVSSVAGHKVGPGSAVYAATKHAVRALSEGLRQEVKPYHLRTTVISPGAVATELPSTITDEQVGERLHQFYEQTAIPADSFARAVVSQKTWISMRSSSDPPARCCEGGICMTLRITLPPDRWPVDPTAVLAESPGFLISDLMVIFWSERRMITKISVHRLPALGQRSGRRVHRHRLHRS
ncbi:short-chain dehydrogenase/reductase SDR [Deinococcus geothermalis DSM 11300]|uniref:Short-chain dehydrogenase/reductase SDR n=1 Tax=Deinococcus geothermalis (strain DSM 11300 / CIP 105573 / AG-3a) TaxID=319795 RepID=Q1IW52_DEIGD|nr:SDR family oxidoreductase [Deinococcus geothermalis]ABF46532.1 short-chain dehydrogenase/reductase SDR [Deinococcus geothermalis DSM 11300]